MKITIDRQSVLSTMTSEKTETASQWSPGKAVHGYRFPFHVRAKGDYDFIQEKLLGLPAAIEGDERMYSVSSVHMSRSTFTNGAFVDAEFDIAISEEDAKPTFTGVEISAVPLSVIGYEANKTDQTTIHRFLVKANKDEFSRLAEIVNGGGSDLTVKRIGVDAEPFACRVGGANYWSQHDTTDGEHFIRIVNCVIDHKPLRPGLGFASAVRASNLEEKVAHLTLQVQFLLQRMRGVLSEGDLATLASPDKLTAVTDGAMDDYWTDLDRSVDARRWLSDEEAH